MPPESATHDFTVVVPHLQRTERQPYRGGHNLTVSMGVLTVLDPDEQPVRIYGPAGWLHVEFPEPTA